MAKYTKESLEKITKLPELKKIAKTLKVNTAGKRPADIRKAILAAVSKKGKKDEDESDGDDTSNNTIAAIIGLCVELAKVCDVKVPKSLAKFKAEDSDESEEDEEDEDEEADEEESDEDEDSDEEEESEEDEEEEDADDSDDADEDSDEDEDESEDEEEEAEDDEEEESEESDDEEEEDVEVTPETLATMNLEDLKEVAASINESEDKTVVDVKKLKTPKAIREAVLKYIESKEEDKPTKGGKTKWKVGDKCRVKYEGDWYNGKIKAIKGKKFTVFCTDDKSTLDAVEKDLAPPSSKK